MDSHSTTADRYVELARIAFCARRYDEAKANLEAAVRFDPAHWEALSELGTLLLRAGRIFQGLHFLDRAAEIRPDAIDQRIDSIITRANVTGEVALGVRKLQQILSTQPFHVRAGRNLLYLLTAGGGASPQEVLQHHRAWGERLEKLAPKLPNTFSLSAPPPLRLGFVSPDLRSHSVARFMAPLWQHFPRDGFEIIGYSDSPQEDRTTEYLKSFATRWRHVAGWTDQQIASQIRADEIHILFDLAGHTADGRGRLLAARLAPVQASWLGYPNTTGIGAIKYRITDAHVDPPGDADALHTERLLRLRHVAWCFEPPSDAPAPEMPPLFRQNEPTFCSFNNTVKLSPLTLDLWAKLLKSIPRARLLLKSRFFMDPEVQQYFRDKFRGRGIEPSRLRLLPHTTTIREHLASYHQADVALDPFPYHGTTTTCEALFMGVPVVSLQGSTHASRVGVSLLNCVGHPDWIANTPDAYIAIAQRLVEDSSRLAVIRRELRSVMQRSALMNGPLFAGDFADACTAMWDACSGMRNAP